MEKSTLHLLSLLAGSAVYASLILVLVRRLTRRSPQIWLTLFVANSGAWFLLRLVRVAAAWFPAFAESDVQIGLKLADRILGVAAWPVGAVVMILAWRARHRSFSVALGLCGLASAAGSVAFGLDSVLAALSTLPVPLCVASFLYREQLFGLVLRRHTLAALLVGGSLAIYLAFVQKAVDIMEQNALWPVDLLRPVLLLLAGLLAVPAYLFVVGRAARRDRLRQGDLGRVLDEAARLLTVPERLSFLAREACRLFSMRAVCLAELGDEPRIAAHPQSARVPEELITRLSGSLAVNRLVTLPDPPFTHAVVLGAGEHRNTMLLLDARPRAFLDADEPAILAAASSFAHLAESGRLIEEKLKLEREVARQEHLAALGRVAAAIAHEIKNPLSSIGVITQVLREDQSLSPQSRRDLDYILSETRRLAASIEQLLGFSRPLDADRTPVNVTALAHAVVESARLASHGSSVTLRAEIEPGLALASSNTELLRQALSNVLINALHAASSGGEVHVEVRAASGELLLAVTDNGPGIPPAIREHIFEPFFSTKQKGTGLGLAIALKAVRHLGGSMSLESPVEDGHGARFEIRLPLA